jgi:radical SAM enzyme (TIGR01210 family)
MSKIWEGFSAVEDFFDPQKKKKTKRWVLLLPALSLCHWYLQCGGCTMCGFNGPSSGKQKFAWITKYFGRAALHFLYWLGYFGIRNQKPESLTIYNGGNFLNSGRKAIKAKAEIPLSLQLAICRHIGQHPTINKVFVESRPEFISDETIAPLVKLLNGKILQIGIGLESADENVRNHLLNKGMSRSRFEQAITTIKENGAESLAYVFLKPMGLSEEEAVADTISTIRYCFEIGVDEIALSCAFIQEGTVMHDLYQQGKYQPPNLWSILKVIKATAYLGPIRIGGFEDDPPPIAVPSSCPSCNQKVTEAIERYRECHDLSLFSGLTCHCQE